MDHAHLHRRFGAIGAGLVIGEYRSPSRYRDLHDGYSLDVDEDRRRGEHFVIRLQHDRMDDLELTVPALDAALRHLVLQARRHGDVTQFLCGHDERHWFIATLPRNVTGVDDALAALKPRGVLKSEYQTGMTRGQRRRRHNAAWKRQGEWFFVPAPWLDRQRDLVYHRNEPLRRGAGKPHVAEFLHRISGKPVYVSPDGREVLSEADYVLLRRQSAAGARGTDFFSVYRRLDRYRFMVRDPKVYVRGRVRHPDHATLVLHFWHRVLPNREPGWAWGGRLAPVRFRAPLAFLD
jgi:hypothetical protein